MRKILRKRRLNERLIKAVMYKKEKERITNKEYRELTGLSDEGVTLDLLKLFDSGMFELKGKGRNTYYQK
jgi:ATP-dependent DNA helicase RecG